MIASQAVISGAFSLTRQAIQLGFLPRMNVMHTSDRQIGQIFAVRPALSTVSTLAGCSRRSTPVARSVRAQHALASVETGEIARAAVDRGPAKDLVEHRFSRGAVDRVALGFRQFPHGWRS